MPWEPHRDLLTCRECALRAVALKDELRVIDEDRRDRHEHIRSCEWCSRNKGTPMLGGLLAACWERRKLLEAAAKACA